MQRRNKLILAGVASGALALGIPAIAQDKPESILPPGFGESAAPTAAPAPTSSSPANTSPSAPAPAIAAGPAESGGVEEVSSLDPAVAEAADEVAKQPDIPDSARQDPQVAGLYSPQSQGLPGHPWGTMSGESLGILIRRMEAPISSRWAHIGLRGALTVAAPAPGGIDPVDWTAERAWLLLRMGEADASRLLIAKVDSDRFTPKMQQISVQSALAGSDPAAMCLSTGNIDKVEPKVAMLISAICASLSGQPERAAADIQTARRRGKLAPIDVALADKVVGAAAESSRAVTVEWEPVDALNSWRYGLSTATAMMPPERLVNDASLQTRAWLARAPMFNAEARLPSARIAAGLGVFSNQALVDLYSQIYDATDPDALGGSDAWQLRLAYIGKDREARLDAMRRLWASKNDGTDGVAGRVLLARAARYIAPGSDVESDATNLVASLFAGGFDREAARWIPVVNDMGSENASPVWGMLAVGAPRTEGLEVTTGMVSDYYDADKSEDKFRTGMLVASLAGLGRIDTDTINSLSGSYKLGLGQQTGWTRMIDGAADRGQAGTVIVLAALALQGRELSTVKPFYVYHLTNALRRTGQEYLARMIAAEAVAQT
nr:hypothetical protein [uncultured Sphingomonas sp.]